MVSNVKKVIPEQVKTMWHEYRHKSAGSEAGGQTVPPVSEEARAAGWGVQEADQRTAQEGASESHLFPALTWRRDS